MCTFNFREVIFEKFVEKVDFLTRRGWVMTFSGDDSTSLGVRGYSLMTPSRSSSTGTRASMVTCSSQEKEAPAADLKSCIFKGPNINMREPNSVGESQVQGWVETWDKA